MKSIIYQIILLSFLVSSIVFSQNVFAGELSPTVPSGTIVLDFRDIADTSVYPDPTISLDKATYRQNEIATITINDINANLNTTAIDFATAIVSGSSVTLTESGISSGIFSGTYTVGSVAPDVDYTGDSAGAARARVTLPLSSGGDVILSDNPFPTNAGLQLNATIGSLNVTLTNGAAFSATKPTIVLSFANANIPAGVDDLALGSGLEMWHKAPGQSWEIITNSCDSDIAALLSCDNYNFADKTITSNPSGAGFTGTDGQGLYVLGYNTGIPGGGGGGLVSPGLVVNALAGLAGGGGGGSPQSSLANLISNPVIDVPEEIQQMVRNHDQYTSLLPMDPDSFEGFDLPLVINDQGYVLGGFSNTLQTQIIEPDTPVTMKFTVYTADKVQHFSMYTNLRDTNDSISKSDTQILYNDGKDLQIKDPNGFFSDAKVTVIEEEDSVKKYIIVEMTFAKEMDTSHIITRMWDSHLRSGDTHILDAIKVESAIPEFDPTPQLGEEVQVQELKSQVIPKWVKSNAEWWVDEQIDDEVFITGIQYMINNGIMYVPNTDAVNSSVTEIPDWIKSNADWWVNDQIADDEFVKAIEWLVTNGVISIE